MQIRDSKLFVLSRRGTVQLIELFVLSLSLVIFFDQASHYFAWQMGKPLNPDVLEFVHATQMDGFLYVNSDREPLHVFLLKLFLWWVPNQEQAIRVTTIAESLFAIFCVFWGAKQLVGRVPALLTVLLVGSNPVLAYYSVSGLRAPLYMGLVLLWAGLLGRLIRDKSSRLAIPCGVVGALLILTRSYAAAYIGISLAGLLVFSCQNRRQLLRRQWRTFVSATVTFAVLVLPDFIFRQKSHVSLDLNRMKQFEKTGSIILDGPPKKLETTNYIFQDRTLFDICEQIGHNSVLYLTDYLPFFLDSLSFLIVFIPLGLLGAVLRRDLTLCLLALSSLFPFIWVLGYDLEFPGSGVENRLVLHAYPLFVLLIMDTISRLVIHIMRLLWIEAGVTESRWSTNLKAQLLPVPISAQSSSEGEAPDGPTPRIARSKCAK